MLIDELLLIPRAERMLMHPYLQFLEQAQIYRVDEIARYAYAHVENWNWANDVPNVAPMAPVVWMEWQTAQEPIREWEPLADEVMGLLMHAADARSPALREKMATHALVPEDEIAQARWWVITVCISHLPDGRIATAPFALALTIGADGGLLRRRVCVEPERVDDAREEEGIVSFQTFIACLATCFAHCKNVQATEQQQATSRQQRRARERAGHPSLVSYKTLDIGPVTRILRDEGQVEKTGLKHALHLCRGHFRHYAPGQFFGRNPESKTVWIPMHARGSKEAGLALKDYRVLTEPTKTS